MKLKHESLWIDTSARTRYPVLQKDIEADVAIVGGGIAGLVTAYFLLNEGKKVVVLDAKKIAEGTTGYTTAKVTVIHDAKFEFLEKNYGLEKTEVYAQSHQWAIDALENIIEKEKIRCSFQRVNGYLYTTEIKHVHAVEKEYQVAAAVGLPVAFEENVRSLPFPIKAALKVKNQAIFHPRNFLLALAKVMVGRGCRIFENSPVEKVMDGVPCIIETQKAKVRASKVIIATNYPIIDESMMFLKLGQMQSYALAIQTSDEVPKDIYIGYGKHEFTVRTYEEGKKKWVIIGGEDHPTGETEDTQEKYQKLEELTRQNFHVKSIDYMWTANDTSPIDRVLLTGKMSKQEHVYLTTGYGEWGMASSVMSAKLLTDLIIKRKNPWQELYDPQRLNVRASIGKSFEMGKQVVKGLGAYIARHDDPDLRSLNRGEGRVITQKGEKLAVCKDANGRVCVLSAVCTHMGCIVAWNKAEQTWDCPCHGSRFTSQGNVLQGPAVQPLKKKIDKQ